MYCSNCGTQYPDDMNACPNCGKPNYEAPPGSMTSTPEGSRAVGTFVLGILSIVIPGVGLILGIIAIIMGTRSRTEFVRTDPRYSLANAGWIMGIIGTCLQAARWIWW